MIIVDVRALQHATVQNYVEKLTRFETVVFAAPTTSTAVPEELESFILTYGPLISMSSTNPEMGEAEFWLRVFHEYPAHTLITNKTTTLASAYAADDTCQPAVKLLFDKDTGSLRVF